MPRATTTEDVKKLVGLDILPGTLIPWAAIEEVLAPLTRQDRRFHTIVHAFIVYMKKWHNSIVRTKPGVGLYVLQDRERAADVMTTLGRTSSLVQRATSDADTIPIIRLEGLDLEHAQHVRLSAHRLAAYTAEELIRWATLPGMPAPTPAPPRRPSIAPGESRVVSTSA